MDVVNTENQPELTDNNVETKEKCEQSAEATAENVAVEEKTGEFEYMERNEFTSEIYKIEVKNIGYFGIGEFKKLLKNTLKLDMTKIKSPNLYHFKSECTLTPKERGLQEANFEIMMELKSCWQTNIVVFSLSRSINEIVERHFHIYIMLYVKL